MRQSLSGTYQINHRKILDGIFAVCGVPSDKTRTISSAVDKLDKSPWAEVKNEMCEEKGLDPAVADEIGEYVKLKGKLPLDVQAMQSDSVSLGGEDLLARLQADTRLTKNKQAKEGLQDMQLLFTYLKAFGILDKVC